MITNTTGKYTNCELCGTTIKSKEAIKTDTGFVCKECKTKNDGDQLKGS